MSRVGKYPVTVPAGTTVQVADGTIEAKGKLGQRSLKLVDEVEAVLEEGKLWIKPRSDSQRARMMWGTYRALAQSLVTGVSEGFTKALEISGVGYRAAVEGKTLKLQLGYSHDVIFPIPSDVQIKTERPTAIAVSGIDRQRVGQVAAEIRAYRGPEPYKGKGIRYADETILRKEGKKK
ncbi:large subunit ribosomal protein L6 [Constrictibacter sp. MBR-5]|jgi:large subunit ribosomal protein L6|uniref:50S ribosomal protein L6 n=1 Tax=Constrictibacter sp. MBR-5 TaxID=3156467 RepID=UPI003399159C